MAQSLKAKKQLRGGKGFSNTIIYNPNHYERSVSIDPSLSTIKYLDP